MPEQCRHQVTWGEYDESGAPVIPNNEELVCEKCGATLLWAAPNSLSPKGILWLPDDEELESARLDRALDHRREAIERRGRHSTRSCPYPARAMCRYASVLERNGIRD